MKISDKKMGDKVPLEMQVKELEKSLVTIVKAFKDLKASVKALEEKSTKSHDEDIQELMNRQKTLEEVIEANSDAIKRIDAEILNIKNDKAKADISDKNDKEAEKKDKKCKYFDRGHCKYKTECKFSHPDKICKDYLERRKCDPKTCKARHPKICKWSQQRSGCRRQNCDYLHVTLASDDRRQINAHKSFPCIGCQNCYDDVACVVQHKIENSSFYLCLNCEDWIKHKEKIITPGWSLFDHNGALRRDV